MPSPQVLKLIHRNFFLIVLTQQISVRRFKIKRMIGFFIKGLTFQETNNKKIKEVLRKVGDTGFEPVTSAMSTQRSKPTELIALL